MDDLVGSRALDDAGCPGERDRPAACRDEHAGQRRVGPGSLRVADDDALALADATVGIAMGAEGSDVALTSDKLSARPFAVGPSWAARRVVR